ncbi:hypothetical protein B0I31_111139 [Saccharothrix carnea]|uniref:Uncharacterized protein n=1 Tax=Saccharothrix carnea TaxID=1280637 RepID=A0A2P8I311_SACCR|nr:hypothetical protein [Saccharothrix carnea]PSL52852.1 hypothetical protein B0I31_111139 [Saccharothrix carnea]
MLRGSGRTAIAESADARSTAIATSPLTSVLDRGDLLTHAERVLRPARR